MGTPYNHPVNTIGGVEIGSAWKPAAPDPGGCELCGSIRRWFKKTSAKAWGFFVGAAANRVRAYQKTNEDVKNAVSGMARNVGNAVSKSFIFILFWVMMAAIVYTVVTRRLNV